jgi:hypothetical protein
MTQQRIVCAAIQFGPKLIVCGVRHFDLLMYGCLAAMKPDAAPPLEKPIHGFVDNRGIFLNRQEAWKVAEAAGQIIRRVGGDHVEGGTLYSENLY